MKYARCIFGIHRYKRLKIYNRETDTWFKMAKCSVCGKVKGKE